MKEARWGKEFTPRQRSLEEIERRNIVTGSGALSEESVAKCLAANTGWKGSSRFDVWATRAFILIFAYVDRAAMFLIGFLLGYVVSALR